MAKKSSNIIRKTFPKIRTVIIKGEKLYQVDARRQGTTGKREYFTVLKEAETRAGEIATELQQHGTEALVSSVLRNMALQGEAMFKPYGKTIADAHAHYKAYLDDELARSASKTIDLLAEEWYQNKLTGSNRKLKASTLTGIKQHSKLLKEQWGKKHLLDFKEKDLQEYLDSLTCGQRNKFNIRSLTSQFFNWCIRKTYTKSNPVEGIEITVPRSKIYVLTPEQAQKHLEVCVEKHPEFTLYVAISLFAGLRPMECQLLKWENIHLDEMQITVLDETSKIAETRNVPIENNLLLWLNAHKGERKGFVTRQTNFANKIKAVRVDMGYKMAIFKGKKVNGKMVFKGEVVNPNGEEWKEDAYRHSYASYWVAKNKDRAHLAEHMGNSLEVIKRHYKQVIANSAQEAYWHIKPGFPENVISISEKTLKEVKRKKLAEVGRKL